MFQAQLCWIRHAYSCANHLAQNPLMKPFLYFTPDAILTDTGVEQAKRLNQVLKRKKAHFDILVCSTLRRSLETALFAFDGVGPRIIYVVPYVNEEPIKWGGSLGFNRFNVPVGLEESQQYWEEMRHLFPNTVVDFSLVNEENMGALPDYPRFATQVLPQLYAIVGKPKFRVGIVSHSMFIMKHLEQNHNFRMDRKIGNTGIVIERVQVTPTGFTHVALPSGKRVQVISKGVQEGPANADTTRCQAHSSVLFGGSPYYADYKRYATIYNQLKNTTE